MCLTVSGHPFNEATISPECARSPPKIRLPFAATTKLPPVSFWWWVWQGLGRSKCLPCIAVRRGVRWVCQGQGQEKEYMHRKIEGYSPSDTPEPLGHTCSKTLGYQNTVVQNGTTAWIELHAHIPRSPQTHACLPTRDETKQATSMFWVWSMRLLRASQGK